MLGDGLWRCIKATFELRHQGQPDETDVFVCLGRGKDSQQSTQVSGATGAGWAVERLSGRAFAQHFDKSNRRKRGHWHTRQLEKPVGAEEGMISLSPESAPGSCDYSKDQ